jgi:hypothetical protein
MKRTLAALAALACLSAPALADTCAAATEAATRAALDAAAATGRRTATVRVTCGGERQTFVLHRSQTATGTSVSVREIQRSADKTGLAGQARGASTARIIRIGE